MSDDRTHEPTRKRRIQARQEGRVVASPILPAALAWTLLAALVYASVPFLVGTIQELFQTVWLSQEGHGSSDTLYFSVRALAQHLAPILGLILLFVLLGRTAQMGALWVPNLLVPRWNRLASAHRVSGERIPAVLLQLLLVIFVVSFGGQELWNLRVNLLEVSREAEFVAAMIPMLSEAALKIGLVLCFCAIVDYGYRRYCFELSLRMTPEDVRAEVQAIEPNPWITSERKQRYQQWRNEAVGENELNS